MRAVDTVYWKWKATEILKAAEKDLGELPVSFYFDLLADNLDLDHGNIDELADWLRQQKVCAELAKEAEEGEPRRLVRLGVRRGIQKALWEIEVEILGALDEVELSDEDRTFLKEEIATSAIRLKRGKLIDDLVASAINRDRLS